MEKLTSSFSISTLTYFLSSVCYACCVFIINIFIARYLGPEGKGVVSLLLFLPVVVYSVVSLGLHQSNIYYLGKKEDETNSVLTNAIVYSVISGCILAVVVWCFRASLSQWLFLSGYSQLIGLSAFLFPLVLVYRMFQHILLGQKRVIERNISIVSYGLVFCILISLFVLFYKLNINDVIIISIISYTISALYSYLAAIKNHRVAITNINIGLFYRTVKFGIKSQLGLILQITDYRLALYIVNYFCGTASVGIYSVAVHFAELLIYIPTAIGTVLFSHISHMNETAMESHINSASRKTVILVLVSVILFALFNKKAIQVFFGLEFLTASLPLLILLPGIVAMSVSKILSFALMGMGRPQYYTYISAIALCLMIVMSILFIPLMDIVGAALACSLSYTLSTYVTVRFYIKNSNSTVSDLLVPKIEDFEYFINFFKKYIFKVCLRLEK